MLSAVRSNPTTGKIIWKNWREDYWYDAGKKPIPWTKDQLRHSFGRYYLARCRNEAVTAFIMGDSPRFSKNTIGIGTRSGARPRSIGLSTRKKSCLPCAGAQNPPDHLIPLFQYDDFALWGSYRKYCQKSLFPETARNSWLADCKWIVWSPPLPPLSVWIAVVAAS